MRTESIADTESANAQTFYSWHAPGKPLSIRISFDVIDRIRLEAARAPGALPRRHAEIGGILLGTAHRFSRLAVKIEACVPVACEHAFGASYILSGRDRQEFEDALRRWEPAPSRTMYAVGFYRSHTREDFHLAEEDFALFNAYFSDPSRVALVVQPHTSGPGLAGFFFWEDGRIRPGESCFEFPVDRAAPGGGAPCAAPDRSEEMRPAKTAPPSARSTVSEAARQPWPAPPDPGFEPALPDSLEVRRPPNGRAGRAWWLGLSVALLLTLATFWLWRGWRPFTDPYALGLKVVDYGDTLQLTWSRNAPAILRAERGILIIGDGDQSRSLELDGRQLRHGAVAYRKVSGPVSFHLELFLSGGRTVSETCESKSSQPAAPRSGAAPPSAGR